MSTRLTLECAVISGQNEVQSMTFSKDGELQPPSSDLRQIISFSAVRKSDEGQYICGVLPKTGSVIKKGYYLRVVGKSILMRIGDSTWEMVT